jgi:hypothetical protein
MLYAVPLTKGTCSGTVTAISVPVIAHNLAGTVLLASYI